MTTILREIELLKLKDKAIRYQIKKLKEMVKKQPHLENDGEVIFIPKYLWKTDKINGVLDRFEFVWTDDDPKLFVVRTFILQNEERIYSDPYRFVILDIDYFVNKQPVYKRIPDSELWVEFCNAKFQESFAIKIMKAIEDNLPDKHIVDIR